MLAVTVKVRLKRRHFKNKIAAIVGAKFANQFMESSSSHGDAQNLGHKLTGPAAADSD
jgi:hypothetical protein